MKRLVLFSLKSFTGPFIVTLLISMFMLILQFFWVYIDDLMGKGLSVWVILELLVYVSAGIVPLALPLAILLSSLMAFGNLSEHNELTALKASGFSLLRIMRPLIIIVFLIATATFFFANYVIPAANLKWHTLIFDIQNKKISTILTPGIYSKHFEGYAIKIDSLNGNKCMGVTIHDYTLPTQLRTVRAKEANVYKSENGRYIFLNLKSGSILEELDIQNPMYLPNKTWTNPSNRPSRISHFNQGVYKLDLGGLDLNRSKEDLFTDKYEMLNVFQINDAIDSIDNKKNTLSTRFVQQNKLGFLSLNDSLTKRIENDPGLQNEVALTNPIEFRALSAADQQLAINLALSKIRRNQQQLENQGQFLQTLERETDLYWIEFHRKFALTYAIIVLFFVGAPLGALIKKGGFGAPVVIAAIIFLLYFIVNSVGDNLADTNSITPFVGMWMAGLLFTPVAIYLTKKAQSI
ncbi:MAG: YjgP/YjgQ family permease [Sphingomonadales bacterium]|nr:YjgP/YjgQ family permease [Sphingomonadales bacterium]